MQNVGNKRLSFARQHWHDGNCLWAAIVLYYAGRPEPHAILGIA